MTKLLKAINFATAVHKGQSRKGKPEVPYITHPLSVGLLLSQTGAEEETIIAGILHDTIEDCIPWGSITKEIIAQEFGKNVAEMVNDVTDQDPKQAWQDRKKLTIEHIPHMKKGSLQVKSADLLHNMNDQFEDYKIVGEDLFKRFHAPKTDQVARYKDIIKALEKADRELPLLSPLNQMLNKLIKLWV